MELNPKSNELLQQVHPDLAKVVRACATVFPGVFQVTEGRRDLERQKMLVAKGKSKTLKSRHLTGHAVDLTLFVDGQPTWKNPKDYTNLSIYMLKAAKDAGVHVRWGGDFDEDGVPAYEDTDSKFFDGPHFELSHKEYPALGPAAA